MEKFELITLAALFHDIGKFAQLAVFGSQHISPQNLESGCPAEGADSTFLHTLLADQFFSHVLMPSASEILSIIRFHHSYDKADSNVQPNARLVALADWCANGSFRGVEQQMSSAQLTTPMESIFSHISLNKHKRNVQFISPAQLTPNLNDRFPFEFSSEAFETFQQQVLANNPYKELWNAFLKECQLVDYDAPFRTWFEQLFNLMEKYTVFIPSLSADCHHISLFHHSKTCAAIAACLHYLPETHIQTIVEAMAADEPARESLSQASVVLFGCDLSGIQSFIYSVTSEHALKGLRGRSFYLQLLGETFVRAILDYSKMTPANVLYSGGGNFYVLLPINSDLLNNLDTIQHHIEHNLFVAHHSHIAMITAFQELSFSDFIGNNFGVAFKQFKQKLAREKRRKFLALLKQDPNTLFDAFDTGGEQKVCCVCSAELTADEQSRKDEESPQCDLCESFAELSRDLAHTQSLKRVSTGNFFVKGDSFSSYTQVLESFGFRYTFEKMPNADYRINSTEFINSQQSNNGFLFFPKHAPLQSSGTQIKTLEHLSKTADGQKTWGVYRADVDHLGAIFGDGLGVQQNIASIATLSYFIGHFFSAHIESIIQSSQEFKDNIYLIYSGGDDMFALGTWSTLPQFAAQVYADFRSFTCHNPDVTLSGGIYIAPSDKFPVYQAAESAGDALERAKLAGRDRLNFLDENIPWQEFERIEKLKSMLVELLTKDNASDKTLPRSLLYTIHYGWAEKQPVKEKQEENKEEKKNNISVFRIWRLLYALKRYQERYKDFVEPLKKLETELVTKYDMKEYVNISTRWAELLTKKTGE